MTKSKLMSYVGKKVYVRLFDEDTIHGVLEYTDELSDRVRLRKKGFFTIGNIDFKVSHVKNIQEDI